MNERELNELQTGSSNDKVRCKEESWLELDGMIKGCISGNGQLKIELGRVAA